MRLQKQRFPALLKRTKLPGSWRTPLALLSIAALLAGCAGGSSGTSRFSDFFGIGSATPTPTVEPTPTPTPTSMASPVAVQTATPPRKTARQARSAENAKGPVAKPTTGAESKTEQTSADVSLEPTPEATEGDSRAAGATPGPSASEPGSNVASVSRAGPMLSSPQETSGPRAEADPAKAAKLVHDVDQLEKRVDRKNLNADDSQRDILAQRLLQEAKKALAERDTVAAISLATKASTLLDPLPKVADSTIPPAP